MGQGQQAKAWYGSQAVHEDPGMHVDGFSEATVQNAC